MISGLSSLFGGGGSNPPAVVFWVFWMVRNSFCGLMIFFGGGRLASGVVECSLGGWKSGGGVECRWQGGKSTIDSLRGEKNTVHTNQ